MASTDVVSSSMPLSVSSSSPPPYTSIAQLDEQPPTSSVRQPESILNSSSVRKHASRPLRPTPSITLLFLGSPGVGKSTFISQIPHVRDGGLQPPPISSSSLPSSRGADAVNQVKGDDKFFQDSTSPEPSQPPKMTVPNPMSFSVSLFARPYDITIHRSTSTLFVDPFPPNIDLLVLCYAVNDRTSLYNVQKYWRRMFAERYERDLGIEVPILLLGLRRDLRTGRKRRRLRSQRAGATAATAERDWNEVNHDEGEQVNRAYLQSKGWRDVYLSDLRSGASKKKRPAQEDPAADGYNDDNDNDDADADEEQEEFECVMPEEAVRIANEMRCDRYAECSSLTGELMFEALEDITRMAALTTTSKGGFSEGSSCIVC